MPCRWSGRVIHGVHPKVSRELGVRATEALSTVGGTTCCERQREGGKLRAQERGLGARGEAGLGGRAFTELL